jgi:hypothetical protein
MAATLDKDTLVKHSFWILAGGYVVLVFGCIAVLATSVGSSVQKEQETLKKAEDTVKGISNPKNGDVVAAYKKQDDLVNGKKDDVWKKAWDTQKDMMTWPRGLAARFQKYKYFGDLISPYDRSDFKQQYQDQFAELLEVVDPVGADGQGGVVQCKGGDWAAVLNLVEKEKFGDPPTSPDIWLAQEELWVKREMLRIIHDANEYVARFKEVTPETQTGKDGKAGPPAGKDAKSAKPEAAAAAKDQKSSPPVPAAARTDPNHKIYRNPYWEFDLTLAEQTRGKYVLRGKITNISKRKRALDTKFKVFLQDPRAVTDPSSQPVTVQGLPLAVGESKDVNQTVDSQRAIEGLFGVEQSLNWRTAAVKRLDDLQLMYHSSRTAVRALKPPRTTVLAFKPADTTEGGDSSASADASAQSATAPAAGSATYGPATAQTAGTTPAGLLLERYADVSESVRHMPVAMVVVVDEEDLPQVLAAFVNSKLRIQITQYHWHHCRDRMNPQLYSNEGGPPVASSGPSFMNRERGPAISSSTRGPGMMIGGRSVTYGVRSDYPGPGGGSRATRPGGPGVPYNAGGRPTPAGPGPMRSGPMVPSGGRTPIMPGSYGSGAVSEEDQEQEDLNLLEVAVYGLASLYERFPPKPPEQAPAEEKKPEAGATDSK